MTKDPRDAERDAIAKYLTEAGLLMEERSEGLTDQIDKLVMLKAAWVLHKASSALFRNEHRNGEQ